MFLGREYELQYLENIYKRDTDNIIIIFGKRRIGKTFLVKEFSRNKPHIDFLAIRESSREFL